MPPWSSAHMAAAVVEASDGLGGDRCGSRSPGSPVLGSCSAKLGARSGLQSEQARSRSRRRLRAGPRRRKACGCARRRRYKDSGGTETVPLSTWQMTTPLFMAVAPRTLLLERVLFMAACERAFTMPFSDVEPNFTTFGATCVTAQRKGTGASMMESCRHRGQMGSNKCCQLKGQSSAASPKTTAELNAIERDTTNTRNSSSRAMATCSTESTSRCSKSGKAAHSISASQRCRACALAHGGQSSNMGGG
mmetsp:Transcript_60544/g.194969  ORF Transcript_60544/g.194969 Transcript_60544/m.194969 type:complete len:249 (-) Transcript_60544:1629-2375(-)